MIVIEKTRNLLMAGVIAGVFAVPVVAYALPQPMQGGGVTYISGGIGTAEENAIKAAAGDYNLQISNADKKGEFKPDTNLTIESQNGRTLINADDAGPLFYAKLPPGVYKIDAINGDQHWDRQIKISAHKPTNLHLIWAKQS